MKTQKLKAKKLVTGKFVSTIKISPSKNVDKILPILLKKLSKHIGKKVTRKVEADICSAIIKAYEKYLKVEVVTEFVEDKNKFRVKSLEV